MKTNLIARPLTRRTETFSIALNTLCAARYYLIILAVALCPSMGLAQSDTWNNKTDMPTARQSLTTCVVNGKIYAIGGVNHPGVDTEVLRTVEEYDPATDSWAQKADMLISKNWAASAVVNGKIYVMGGDRTYLSTPRKTVEEYDPTLDTWRQKADMPTARSTHVAAVVAGKIYVIGGLTTFEIGRASCRE